VIGIPDDLRGEAIKAFVVAESPSEELAAELKALVRERLAAHEVPREIEFVDELPLTTSGKIRRNELRDRRRSRRQSPDVCSPKPTDGIDSDRTPEI
jgi:acetyl-CoA synthetase